MKIHLNVPIKKNIEEIKKKINGNEMTQETIETVITVGFGITCVIIGYKIGHIKTENDIMKKIIGIL